MSAKAEKQIAEMKKQTIGVEIEMNSITREKAAKLASEYFGTGRYENTARRNGYSAWSAWDSQGREWMRSTYSHWCQRTHRTNLKESGKHNGEP